MHTWHFISCYSSELDLRLNTSYFEDNAAKVHDIKWPLSVVMLWKLNWSLFPTSGMICRMLSYKYFSWFYLSFSALLWFINKVHRIYMSLWKMFFVYFLPIYVLTVFMFGWECIYPLCFFCENSRLISSWLNSLCHVTKRLIVFN